MQNYTSFISEIIKTDELKSFEGQFVQIQIRNINQIAALHGDKEIDNLIDKIEFHIKKIFSGHSIKNFYHNRFFLCFIKTITLEALEELLYKLHESIITDSQSLYTLDAKFIFSNISNNNDIYNSIMVISDYLDNNKDIQNISYVDDINHRIKVFSYEHEAIRELRDSLNENSLCFAFQPVIECKTGKIAYHECLLRLSNDDYKLISAGPYIMLAEKYGLINAIDKYVFDMAVKELKNTDNISISVNISNIGIQDKILANHVKKIISDANVGHRMTIEITETAVNNDYENTKNFVNSLKSLGCKIALDDFGVGYTSFNQLKDLSIDVVKIDGSFIRDIDINKKNSIIVDMLIKTAEELGCKTVAEFVEKGSIAKKLIELKVDYMQGNFFSPAVNYRSWSMK